MSTARDELSALSTARETRAALERLVKRWDFFRRAFGQGVSKMVSNHLEAENQELRAQVAELTRRLDEEQRLAREQAARLASSLAETKEQARVLQATLNAVADGVMVANRDGRVTHINPAAEYLVGTSETAAKVEEWSAKYGVFTLDGVTPFPPEELPLAQALQGESSDQVQLILRHAQIPQGICVEVSGRPIRQEDGAIVGGVVVFRDISERKRWEREMEEQLARERSKTDMLERLRAALLEMSTPILEVWDDVLALPVIGVIDSRRSAEMMERLLQAVEQKQCRFVIIDITGVEVLDSATADRLLKMVTAVEILGARCILTGARGAVAQMVVSLGANLGTLQTLRNLKHGLMECFRAIEQEEEARRRPGRLLHARR